MRLRPSPVLLAALATAALLLGACGGDDDTSSDDPSAEVEAGDDATAPPGDDSDDDGSEAGDGGDAGAAGCPEAADVAAAVGAEVEADLTVPDRCGYYDAEGTVSVGIDIEDPTTRTLADIERNQPVDPVDGLGDEAYSVETPGGIVQLGVFADGAHVLVTVQGAPTTTVEAARAVYDAYAS